MAAKPDTFTGTIDKYAYVERLCKCLPPRMLPDGPRGPRGDLYVRISIEVPRSVTRGQEKIIQDLAEAGL